jgi:hypothetical protein
MTPARILLALMLAAAAVLCTLGAQSISVVHIPHGRADELLKVYREYRETELRYERLRWLVVHATVNPGQSTALNGDETAEAFRQFTQGYEFSTDFRVMIVSPYQNPGFSWWPIQVGDKLKEEPKR